LWDPKLADEAERRGQDITGFLNGNYELCKKELLMRILHANAYNVEEAQAEYARLKKFKGDPTDKFTKEEARDFDFLIKEHKKNFATISGRLDVTKSSCMIHYYNWKMTNRGYFRMKKEWKNDYCSICDDGGGLIVCDGCQSAFHLKCIKLQAKDIPDGDWFCPWCRSGSTFSPGVTRRASLFHPIHVAPSPARRLGFR
jgi:hypothetical protein